MSQLARWQGMLQKTHTEEAVQGVMREYAATFSAILEVLPEDIRVGLASDDIQTAAVTALQAEMRHQGTSDLGKLLHEIAHVYAAAAVRLAKIKRDPLAPAQ